MKLHNIFLLLLVCSNLYAQTDSLSRQVDNRWSIEFDFGQNRAVRPFAEGYYSGDASHLFNVENVSHFKFGGRYMFTDVFGFKADFSFDTFKNQTGTSSLPFRSKQYALGLQAVVNLSKLLRFDSFTNRIGLLCHSGLQFSKFISDTDDSIFVTEEKNYGFVLGFTPQFKVTRRLALFLDFTVVNNLRQHLNWDGTYADASNNLNGLYYTSSVGICYYLGSNKSQHVDWSVSSSYFNDLTVLKQRLELLESGFNKSSSTPLSFNDKRISNVSIATDYNSIASDSLSVSGRQDFSKDILSDLKINTFDVFFDKSSDSIKPEFIGNVYKVVSILKAYPNINLIITGYSDPRGDLQMNLDLSIRRARKVADIIINEKINSDRIIYKGGGIDQNSSSTNFGNMLARRVSFEFVMK